MVSAEHSSLRIDPAHDAQGIDLLALWQVLWNYKYLVACVTLFGGLIAVALALMATPVYRAEVVLTEVQDPGMGAASSIASQIGGLASLAGVNIGGKDPGRDAQAVLQSRLLVTEYIERNRLIPEVLGGAKSHATAWFAATKFQRDILSINDDMRKGTTTVTVDWTDPATAAQWANGFVALANELIRTRAMDDANRNVNYLKEQLENTDVVELRRVLYNLIESETKTLMLANGRPEYAFRVVDPATPPEMRISPRRTLMVLVGLVAGFALGVLIASIHNMVRRRRLLQNA